MTTYNQEYTQLMENYNNEGKTLLDQLRADEDVETFKLKFNDLMVNHNQKCYELMKKYNKI